MSRLKFATLFVATLAYLNCSACLSSASILDGFAGIVLAEDRDAESAFSITYDVNGAPIIAPVTNLSQGAFLLAVAEFPNLIQTPHLPSSTYLGNNNTPILTAISLIKVSQVSAQTTINSGPASIQGEYISFEFSAPTQQDWAALAAVFGVPAIAASGDETAILVYQDPPSGAVDHIIASGTITQGLATASNGQLLYEFGFDAGSGAEWNAETKVALGDDPTEIADLQKLGASLDYAASLDLITNHAGPDLDPHNYLSTLLAGNVGQGNLVDWSRLAELQLFGKLGTSFPGVPGAGQWSLPTDSKAYLNVVPEASSVAVWMLLATAAGFTGKRFAVREIA